MAASRQHVRAPSAARGEQPMAGGERTSTYGDGRPVGAVVAMYGLAGAAAAGLSMAFGHNPLECAGWLGARGAASLLFSLGLGVPLGATTIAATRVMVRRTAWAHALHVALRPAVAGATDAALFAIASASAVGEELLFRGLLVPIIGIFASSLVFGLLHQVRGRARWGWAAWATIMGLAFATIYAATGSLAGPILAHAAINHANLRFLRDTDPSPRKRPLGGLLRR